jgi:hypothetical protein
MTLYGTNRGNIPFPHQSMDIEDTIRDKYKGYSLPTLVNGSRGNYTRKIEELEINHLINYFKMVYFISNLRTISTKISLINILFNALICLELYPSLISLKFQNYDHSFMIIKEIF